MDFRKGIPAGSISGIPLRIHVLLPAVLILQVAITAVVYSNNGDKLWINCGYTALVYGPILFLTVLIHELGHCFAARQVGGEAHYILLWPLGGLAYIARDCGPKADIWISAAGPLTHIPMIIIWTVATLFAHKSRFDNYDLNVDISRIDPEKDFAHAVFLGAFWLNVALVLFNLFIPAYPLDGGRILVDCLLLAGLSVTAAAQITIAISSLIILALAVYGILIQGYILLVLAIWMAFTVFQLWKHLSAGIIDQHPMFSYGSEQRQFEDQASQC